VKTGIFTQVFDRLAYYVHMICHRMVMLRLCVYAFMGGAYFP
jgi:hypothetical protein